MGKSCQSVERIEIFRSFSCCIIIIIIIVFSIVSVIVWFPLFHCRNGSTSYSWRFCLLCVLRIGISVYLLLYFCQNFDALVGNSRFTVNIQIPWRSHVKISGLIWFHLFFLIRYCYSLSFHSWYIHTQKFLHKSEWIAATIMKRQIHKAKKRKKKERIAKEMRSGKGKYTHFHRMKMPKHNDGQGNK